MNAPERARRAFAHRFGREAEQVVVAPGRVNLIGEHTDYNDGFVLPMALPFLTAIAFDSVDDERVDVASEGFGEETIALGDPPSTTPAWARYIHGMGIRLAHLGQEPTGWVGCVASDIPPGASLSSSAALEIAAGHAFLARAATLPDPAELARIGQWVENEVFGLPSGVMDQLASAAAAPGRATLIDCRDLSVELVEIPDDLAVVVMDTGTRRQLVESQYADRQATCVRVAAALDVPSLRDADLDDLDAIRADDAVGAKRAEHVITENERTVAFAQALQSRHHDDLGPLMYESHLSLRDRYEVSGPALDHIVEVAMAHPACLGARMTGGGFAGAAVALVRSDGTDAFASSVLESFSAPASQPSTVEPQVWAVRPTHRAGPLI